jgi:hypothetical protein
LSSAKKKSFLVFSGGNDRAVLGFLRALRLCGERAHIIARTTDDKIIKTDFKCDVNWVRPTHELSLGIFKESVERVRKSAGNSTLVVLPSTEYFNTFLLQNRPQIEQMDCEVPLVTTPLYEALTGKRTAARFFGAAGVQSPREIDLDEDGHAPLVAKPLVNVSSSGKTLYPHLLESNSELHAFLKSRDSEGYFFQEFAKGDSLYLLFYFSRDGREYVWSQRNLLQQPAGKSMLLAEPTDFHRSTTASSILGALRDIGFHGLGMVEIIRTKERDLFIEMNPRIWGPIQFCIDQHQPLLQAFIGESLYGDPSRFLNCNPKRRRKRYFWLGGILETIRTGRRPVWHAKKKNLALTLLTNTAFDVYLRGDSWRCFLSSLQNPARAKSHRE